MFQFQGQNIKLSPWAAVFGTMNPSFATIKNLPENMQQLLWPVAMMPPDTALIAEVVLLCCGFHNCKVRCPLSRPTIWQLWDLQVRPDTEPDYIHLCRPLSVSAC